MEDFNTFMTIKTLTTNALHHLPEVSELMGLTLQTLREKVSLNSYSTPELEFFAPLYVSNVCASSCPYCAFRKENKIKRITLSYEQCLQEVLYLNAKGLSSVYCLTGSWKAGGINEINSMTEVNSRGLRAIREGGLFPIMESSPFSKSNFRELLETVDGNGRFVLFQEAYNPDVYLSIHKGDKHKGDPDSRINQINLAIKAGWPEVGIGTLLGLNPNVIEEISYIVAHYKFLLPQVRQITISVPRINPGTGIILSPHISDEQFQKTVYCIRLLCPKAKIVLTGRETSQIRDSLKHITHIWGVQGSTVPGGYTLGEQVENGQFLLSDKRDKSAIIDN
jgi:2-iminoacetate synthase